NSCGSFWLSALRWIFCSIWSHTSARVKSPGEPDGGEPIISHVRSSSLQRNKAPESRPIPGPCHEVAALARCRPDANVASNRNVAPADWKKHRGHLANRRAAAGVAGRVFGHQTCSDLA